MYLLIERKILSQSDANSVHLFSSHLCENIFRDARALSGIYSTRINFIIKQFLKGIDRINALTKLREYESLNKHGRIMFPVHHKVKQHPTLTDIGINDGDIDCDSRNIEEIIIQFCQVAQQIAVSLNVNVHLMKKNLFNMEESSKMAKKLLKFYT